MEKPNTLLLHQPRGSPAKCSQIQTHVALEGALASTGVPPRPADEAALAATSLAVGRAHGTPSAAEEEERRAIVAELRRLRALAKEAGLARVAASASA